MVPEVPASNMWGFGEHLRVKVLGCFPYKDPNTEMWNPIMSC